MKYKPGTHIIATLHSANQPLLSHYGPVQHCLNALVAQFSLQKLGEVYHDFPTGGYTAVICLSESHISLHTWPEHDMVNLDIYLSNFQRNNDGTVEQLFTQLVEFFHASVHQKQILVR
ncbi:MAG: S-adenosylmethionine decarboxylase [Bacteroidetes bacterium]|nr:S-adenosylmethionine decarboxylase [Bacteroidota bacterium]